jgi:hypothetical protein
MSDDWRVVQHSWIEGRCRTNLDDYKLEKWPTAFVAVPRTGEHIEAKSGKSLVVVSVTHNVRQDGELTVPYISIELNL